MEYKCDLNEKDCSYKMKEIVIRKLTAKDAEQFYRLHQEKTVKYWSPLANYESIESVKEKIKMEEKDFMQGRGVKLFAIKAKITDAFLGNINIYMLEENCAEVGYSILPEYRGRGYVTEALVCLMGYAVECWGITEFICKVLKGNIASVRVLEKSGFTLEDIINSEDDPYGKGILVYRNNRLNKEKGKNA